MTRLMGAFQVFAHRGGWDELLYFAVPVIVVLFAIRWVEKRSRQKPDDKPAEAEHDSEAEDAGSEV